MVFYAPSAGDRSAPPAAHPLKHEDPHDAVRFTVRVRGKARGMTRFLRVPFGAEPALSLAEPQPMLFAQELRRQLMLERRQQGPIHCAAIMSKGKLLCWLDTEQNQAVLAEPSAMSLALFQAALVDPLPALELLPIARSLFDAQARRSRPVALRPLLWQVGLNACADNAPLPPLQADTRLRLRRWPDFRVLAHRHDDFRICALLIKHALDVAACSSVLGLPREEVQAFFNAAYLSGYAHPSAAPLPTLTAVSARPAGGNALARMWRDVRNRWSR
jgi:hypothetical protein